MSTMIVSNLSTKLPEDVLTIGGNRRLKVDQLNTYLGKELNLDRVPNVVDSTQTAIVGDIVVDQDGGVVSFLTPTGSVTLSGESGNSPVGVLYEYALGMYVITTSWTDVDFNLSLPTGVYSLSVLVEDGGGKKSIYSGQMPFMSTIEQPVLVASSEPIQMQRQGEDDSVLSLQLVRDPLHQYKVRLQIQGDVAPALAYNSIVFKFRRVV